MKALVYHGPSQRGWDTVADPTIIDPTDIVVRWLGRLDHRDGDHCCADRRRRHLDRL
jgi:hypothetical protein